MELEIGSQAQGAVDEWAGLSELSNAIMTYLIWQLCCIEAKFVFISK